jgi:uncharacterized protein (DUF302 family)/uncharacterized membrane protein YidH (DUF202 family)
MNQTAQTNSHDASANDPRVFFAAERTFLAWIRTGIALMGFGFILARFGIFLRQFQWMREENVNGQQFGASIWLGVTLVAIGVAVMIAAAARHVQLVRSLRDGKPDFKHSSRLGIAVAITLACIGLIMAIYLVIVSRSVMNTSPERTLMQKQDNNGLVHQASNHSVDDTVSRLQKMIAGKGVTLFALVDHSGEAEKAGLKMPPTKLLIFGSPKAGTPLMIAAPSIAIDLPLKLLVWEDEAGKVWITYNSAEYLRDRHHLPVELVSNIAVVAGLAAKAAE